MIGKYKEFVQGWDDATPDMGEGKPWRDGDQVLAISVTSSLVDSVEISDTTWFYVQTGKKASDTSQNVRDIDLKEGETEFPFGYSHHQIVYSEMQKNANNLFDIATYYLFGVVANHFVSGINAALAAVSHNNKIRSEDFSTSKLDHIEIKRVALMGSGAPVNVIALSYKF